MDKITNKIKLIDLTDGGNALYLPEHAVFLDIETTGFSPSNANIWLAGAAFVTDRQLIVEQFFAKSYEEEAALLAELLAFLDKFDTIVTFNGTGFDLPFIEKRLHALEASNIGWQSGWTAEHILGDKNHIDLHRIFSSYKHMFQLENYRQKTFETFLGITREDTFGGGELVNVYKNYIKKPKDTLRSLLLLHNYEDMTGMVRLTALFAFEQLFQGNFSITDAKLSAYKKADGTAGKEYTIACFLPVPLPAALSCANGHYFLHAKAQQAVFRIPAYEGTLKYFYPNYKDYYYLPNEDMAVHKSVASYMEQAYRQKATAATCYGRKTGIFLPQTEEIVTPALLKAYKDKLSYFEVAASDSRDFETLKRYCMHMLKVLKAGK